jgi:hypothetical protein
MKTILILVLSIIIFASDAFSQPEENTSAVNYKFGFGPFISFKAGINGTTSPLGRENAINLSGIPDFGIAFYSPVSSTSKLGICYDFGFSSYSYKVKGTIDATDKTMMFNFISFSPGFNYSGLLIGMTFGFPVSASFGPDLKSDKLNPLVEFRLGYMLPLISDKDGRLNLNLYWGYMLTGVFKDFVKDDPLLQYYPQNPTEKWTNAFNPRAMSLSLGINYMFNTHPAAPSIKPEDSRQ